MLVAALEAFREEADIGRSVRLSSTLPRGTTADQCRRTYQDPAVVEDEDSVLFQEDWPPGVKKQAAFVTAMAVQVDQLQYLPV